MSKRISFLKTFLFAFTIVIDFYAFIGLSAIHSRTGLPLNNVFAVVFWSMTVIFLGMILMIPKFDTHKRDPKGLSRIFLFVGVYFLFYLPKLVFIAFRLIEDLIRLFSWLVASILNHAFHLQLHTLNWYWISTAGLMISMVPFFAILLGILFGRFGYKVEKTDISFEDLPNGLDGLKIVQLSDIHLGSAFGKQKKFENAVSIINSLQPDLVLFTGDLVNNFSEEAMGWEPVFSKIHAKYGKFSVLGNHDYGDYWDWKSPNDRLLNLDILMKIQKDMGFDLIRNSKRIISVNQEKLAIIGVENWGKPPFKQYGDLDASMQGLPPGGFKILLSHDPSHWDAQVIQKGNIQLTLSGHTHAMQFGIRMGKFKWSPSGYIYKRWMGLYRENGQALYVNRGMGYIGFPGRIGMRPEIALLTLRRSSS
jgi:uncharacterized protein